MRAAACVALLLAPALAGCAQGPAPPGSGNGTGPPAGGQATSAADAVLGAARAFDGNATWALVKSQVVSNEPCYVEFANATDQPPSPPGVSACEPRYRVTGSAGNNFTAELIAGWMRAAGWNVSFQPFNASFQGQPLPAHNVVAERAGATNRTLYLVAHYDSRPCADEDADPANRTQPVIGANDGGSGVAVMVELAHVLGARPLNDTLRFVFVDAEDMGDSGHGCGADTDWAQGAEFYASALPAAQVAQARGMVLLDLVGDPGLQLLREGLSAQPRNAPMQDAVWAWGQRLGFAQLRNAGGPYIEDDHVPFAQRGMPVLDVIDLRNWPCPAGDCNVFPEDHHTAHDDLAHVSPASLEAVGQAVLAALLAWDGGDWDHGLK